MNTYARDYFTGNGLPAINAASPIRTREQFRDWLECGGIFPIGYQRYGVRRPTHLLGLPRKVGPRTALPR